MNSGKPFPQDDSGEQSRSQSASKVSRVLVVDDHDDSRSMVEMFLRSRGFQVCTACDGLDAIATAIREKPGLIFMDLSLPGMDGFEAIRQIKAAESGYWPRMVILSAFCDESEVRESALNCGCIACLQKPLDWDKLVSLLERLD